MEFTVRKSGRGDIFKDRVLVPFKFRQGIREGQICQLSTVKAKKLVQIRGKKGVLEPVIYMDAQTRKHFNLIPDSVAAFNFKPVGWWGQLLWASRHADPGLRIAAQLGMISIVLGLLSFTISILALPWTKIVDAIEAVF